MTAKDDGKQVTLRKGDTLTIRLEAVPGTGFSWQVAKNNEAVLKPVGEPSFETPAQPKPGTPEIEVFRFRAEAPGSARLELHYVRPWEKETKPANSFRLDVQVR